MESRSDFFASLSSMQGERWFKDPMDDDEPKELADLLDGRCDHEDEPIITDETTISLICVHPGKTVRAFSYYYEYCGQVAPAPEPDSEFYADLDQGW